MALNNENNMEFTQRIYLSELKKLKDAAEDACRSAYANKNKIDGAVNWADLHCHEAKWTVNDDGIKWYSVVIEECSPTADELRAYIDRYLESHDFSGVLIGIWRVMILAA